jgi:DNA-binding NtrC family response regulator
LIVDDDKDVLLAAEVVLKKEFRTVVTESDPERLPELVGGGSFDVLLLDMNFTAGRTSGEEGIRWLRAVQRVAPATKVILMTAYGAVDTAVGAMKEGASDFVVKPWDNDRLVATVAATMRFSQAARTVSDLKSVQKVLNRDLSRLENEIVGRSPPMRDVLASIEKVAATDASVLILGENGTGKELIARAIHNGSPRSDRAFVHVDLGAISETLFEPELFGHTKGAFTDAKEERPGRFEIASGGTLFLDEIGNLSLQMQAKLLGALQSQTITRVGSDRPVKVDARIVCATNVPPEDMLDKNQFRQDLLYRINTVEIHVPPLRERPDDIEPLVAHYVAKYSRKYGKGELRVDADTLAKLREYRWPGNVRELVHAVERAVIMTDDAVLRPGEFLLQKERVADDGDAALDLEAIEKRAIEKAIAKHAGNLSKAALELGLGRTTLYRKIARHGLQ